MTKILAFAGRKQSGKTSAAQFVSAYVVTQLARANDGLPLSKNFSQTNEGKILVDTTDEAGELTTGELDFERKDEEFTNFAKTFIWPYVKIYSFADELKRIAIDVFGLSYNQCYGTNEEKNSPIDIKWSSMLSLLSPQKAGRLKKDGLVNEYMTAREFLQYFGTDVCRKLYDDCWIKSCFSKIANDLPEIAIITDCRFQNEVKYCKNEGAKVIRFQKVTDCDDSHESENDLVGMENHYFNRNIDNSNMSIVEKNQEVLDTLYKWGWFTNHIPA